MRRRLVVNADDLGLHPRIDEGILEARKRGILTSASVLVTGRSAEAAVRAAQAAGVRVGVHLCLVTALPPVLPVEKVRSLAPGGVFRAGWAALVKAWALGRVRLAEVREELAAQIERARELGAEVDHLDAHQHVHALPGLARVVREIADEARLPVRWPVERPRFGSVKAALLGALAMGARRPARALELVGLSRSGALDERALLEVLDALPEGDFELICHPGREPGTVPEDPAWRYGWEQELGALVSEAVRRKVVERGIELTTYGALFSL
ncbi:MAG TPA: ChbG/HpnK family deacetylase [Myxococcaceae bacterium]|nr:ChbG/HpnK family deacetylase [Myxococcaceae bacterium]